MKLLCNGCDELCMVEIGASGRNLAPTAPDQLVTVRCVQSCFGRWYVMRPATESLAATLQHIHESATIGPLKQNVTVTT